MGEDALFAALLTPVISLQLRELQKAISQQRAYDENKFRKLINQSDQDGFRLIHRACSSGELDICRELFLAGADPNALNSGGDSAMHWACFTGNYGVVDLLLRNGADPLLPSAADGKTPLDACLEEKHGHLLQLLFTSPWKTLFTAKHVPTADSLLYKGVLRIKLGTRQKSMRVVLSLLCRTMFLLHGGESEGEGEGGGFDAIKFDQFICVRRRPKPGKFTLFIQLPARYAQVEFFNSEEEIAMQTGLKLAGGRGSLRMSRSGGQASGRSLFSSFKRSSTSFTLPTSTTTAAGAAALESVTLALYCTSVAGGGSTAGQSKWVEHLQQAGLLGKHLAAVRIQSMCRGFFARRLLQSTRQQQQAGQELVRKRTHLAAKSSSSRFIALDAEHTPVPTAASSPSFSSNGNGSHALALQSNNTPLFASFRRPSTAKVLLRRNTSSFSFRSSSSGGSSSSMGLFLDEAFHNLEDISGFLKKRSETGVSAQLRMWKQRFAVLSHTKAQLQYYDHNKDAKRRKIKRIDFASMLSVTKLSTPVNGFLIRLVKGNTFRFEAVDEEDCKRWVASLRAVLPRDNVAALEIQRVFRGHLARQQVGKLRLLLHWKRQELLQQEMDKIELARQRSFAEHAKRKEEEEAAQCKLDQLEAEAFARRQAEKRKQLAKSIALPQYWKAFVDPNTGKMYYYHKKTKQTRWKLPEEDVVTQSEGGGDGGKKGEAADWKEYVDESSGRRYFVNQTTKQSTWQKPLGFTAATTVSPATTTAANSASNASMWKKHLDKATNKFFYMNERTGERSWTKPAVPVNKSWIVLVDPKSQREYFSNSVTGESVWVLPPGHEVFSQDEMEEPMIAHLEFLLFSGEGGKRLEGDLSKCATPTLLCKALEKIDPDAVDNRCVANANVGLVLNTLGRMGIVHNSNNVSAASADLMWQVLKLDLLLPVSILSFPGLVAACKLPEESVLEFHHHVLPEDKLKRWFGIPVGKSWAQHGLEAVRNKLQIPHEETDVFAYCNQLGLPLYCNGGGEDDRLVFALCAVVFRTFPPPSHECEDALTHTQLDLLHDQERQENVLHNWFGLLPNMSLYQHVRDGTFLIDWLLDKFKQELGGGVVVHRNSQARSEWLDNAEIAIELWRQNAATKLDHSNLQIAPSDLVDGNAGLVLPFLYSIAGASFQIEEYQVLDWANQMVAQFLSAQQQLPRPLPDRKSKPRNNPPRSQTPLPCKPITSFRDKALGNGLFLLCLLHAVAISKQKHSIINWKLVVDPSVAPAPGDWENNCKYLVSLCNTVLPPPGLITWEDVYEVKPTAIFCFAARLKAQHADEQTV
ncbi:hypothetical protein BASA81_003698 [Batrachochytrium salamandrivorans]|nr:hypothetical protein BASA81_003698 [Batrachochytrium salamandrivorans]